MPFDPVAAFPAAFEIGLLVDTIVIRGGETKISSERILDAPAIVRQIGDKDGADDIGLVSH
jgi:hypothetical protein